MGDDAFARHTVEELCAAIASEDAVIAAAQARRYAVIREVGRRAGCIPGVRPGTEAKVVLRSLRAESPDTDVRLARILGELPGLEKALAAGANPTPPANPNTPTSPTSCRSTTPAPRGSVRPTPSAWRCVWRWVRPRPRSRTGRT